MSDYLSEKQNFDHTDPIEIAMQQASERLLWEIASKEHLTKCQKSRIYAHEAGILPYEILNETMYDYKFNKAERITRLTRQNNFFNKNNLMKRINVEN